jgi:4-hydroxymandelate oxidase
MVDDLMASAPSPLAPLTAIPPELQSLADYERRAEAHMTPDTWRHIQAGAGPETTLPQNRLQFDRYRLLPRVLADLRSAGTDLQLFGHRHAAPILLAPVAYHKLVHPQGELAAISAATALDTTMVASTLSSFTLEEIADRARTSAAELARPLPPLWFQLYWQANLADTAALVQRAEDAGYRVLVFTVDAAVKRASLALPEDVEAANLRGMARLTQTASAADGRIVFGTALLDSAPTWDSLDWLRAQPRLPIVVKGILSAGDARRAVRHGADGIIVSNHGGRVVDGLATPLEVLPAIAEAVGANVPVLLDGGVRQGTDTVKALALGARAVLVGRPQLHALAVGGVQGVAHILHMLRAELELAMAATGCASVHEIDRDLLIG